MAWNQGAFDRAQAHYDNMTPEDDLDQCWKCKEWVVELDEGDLCEDCRIDKDTEDV